MYANFFLKFFDSYSSYVPKYDKRDQFPIGHGWENAPIWNEWAGDGSRARDISIFRKSMGWRSSRMTSYAGEVAWRCAEISGPIKKRGRMEKKVARTGTWRESRDLRSRRKPPVLHIRRMMSFVSSFHRPAALNSLYLEFQEERPSYDDINTARDTPAREERAISLAIPLWRTSV